MRLRLPRRTGAWFEPWAELDDAAKLPQEVRADGCKNWVPFELGEFERLQVQVGDWPAR
jgi:hypothetical protein